MEFGNYLTKQMTAHPCMQPQDIVKMCYQATFGAEHLLSDMDGAKKYFYEEYDELCSKKDEPLYEMISEDVCRINMRSWKASGLPAEWLFRMFAGSASISGSDMRDALNGREEKETLFWQRIHCAESLLGQSFCTINKEDWLVYINKYKGEGAHAVHHSDYYREHEVPAYRIVNQKYVRLLPILCAAANVKHDGVKVIAIDGRAASGKTTLSNILKEVIDVDVIRMDDFFVPPALRSAERFAQPGNNIHYERYMEEVLPYITEPETFSYRIFDCSVMDYNGRQEIRNSTWRLVEGAYSTHPRFGDYADVKVFFDIGREEQMARILRRNGEAMAEMFKERWIPMEEAYYEAFDIKKNADVIICGKNEKEVYINASES